jgi:hypothetical protein
MRKACPLPSFLFNTMFALLTRVIKQEKEIKGTQIGKEEVILFLFPENMFLYLKGQEDSTRKLFNLINTFSKVIGYKINMQ